MKKITTLCLSLLCFAGVAQAQQNNKTFRFVEQHADGTSTEIPNGSTLNYTAADAEETPFGTQIKPALYVENTTGDLKAIALTLNIASINEGAAIQFCAAGNCQSFDAAGEYVKNGMEASKNLDDMMLEYIPKSDMDDEGNIICFDGAAAITPALTSVSIPRRRPSGAPRNTPMAILSVLVRRFPSTSTSTTRASRTHRILTMAS